MTTKTTAPTVRHITPIPAAPFRTVSTHIRGIAHHASISVDDSGTYRVVVVRDDRIVSTTYHATLDSAHAVLWGDW